MKQKITRSLAVAMVGALALWGCEKMAPAELSPTVAPAASALTAAGSAPVLSPFQIAWHRFVERVERGEITDPAGQYVAKTTQVGQRMTRPKYNAGRRDANNGYALRANRTTATQTTSTTSGGGIDEPCVVQNYDPCAPCYEGPSGCGGGGGVVSTFTSSEDLGGSGFIHDLKLVGGDQSTSRVRVLNNGYTMLDADLNKGAGGAYLYLCFQRDPNFVLSGLEYYQNQPYSAPAELVHTFQTKKGSVTSQPPAGPYFFDIWQPNQNMYTFWNTLDLNAGAGGDYIYSYQSKAPFEPVPLTVGPRTPKAAIRQVGILSGNSDTIVPPAGWTKYGNDLNDGAGGDFIYFCYR